MRILVITAAVPITSSMPGSPRVYSLFQHISERHEIHLATCTSSIEKYETFRSNEVLSKVFQTMSLLPSPKTMTFWGRQRHRLAQAPYFVTRYRSSGEFRLVQQRLRELIQEKKPDLLYADRLRAAQYILDFNSMPRVVDAHDASSLNFRRTAPYARSNLEKIRWLLGSRGLRYFEVATALAVDAYVVNSPIDQEAIQSYHRDVKVTCIPNGVDTEYFASEGQASEEKTIVFTGVMSYAPNRDAVHFLCKEILPRLRPISPQIQVQLVGSNPPADVRALAGNGVTVTGTVPDVRPYVRRAAVYVSPLRFGTGVKNKILAALAMGKAVVATTESCAGLDVRSDEHLLMADNPDDFAACIVELLTDPSRRRRLGVAGRNLVVERYGWDSMAQQLEVLLETLLARKKHR